LAQLISNIMLQCAYLVNVDYELFVNVYKNIVFMLFIWNAEINTKTSLSCLPVLSSDFHYRTYCGLNCYLVVRSTRYPVYFTVAHSDLINNLHISVNVVARLQRKRRQNEGLILRRSLVSRMALDTKLASQVGGAEDIPRE